MTNTTFGQPTEGAPKNLFGGGAKTNLFASSTAPTKTFTAATGGLFAGTKLPDQSKTEEEPKKEMAETK